MKNIYLIILIFLASFGFSQNLTCQDLKEGKFIIPIENKTDTLYVYDHKTDVLYKHEVEMEQNMNKFILIRNNNEQIEWINEENVGIPTYAHLIWITECSYKLIPKNNDTLLYEEGIVVEIKDVDKNCMKYKSVLSIENDIEMYNIGIICKETEN